MMMKRYATAVLPLVMAGVLWNAPAVQAEEVTASSGTMAGSDLFNGVVDLSLIPLFVDGDRILANEFSTRVKDYFFLRDLEFYGGTSTADHWRLAIRDTWWRGQAFDFDVGRGDVYRLRGRYQYREFFPFTLFPLANPTKSWGIMQDIATRADYGISASYHLVPPATLSFGYAGIDETKLLNLGALGQTGWNYNAFNLESRVDMGPTEGTLQGSVSTFGDKVPGAANPWNSRVQTVSLSANLYRPFTSWLAVSGNYTISQTDTVPRSITLDTRNNLQHDLALKFSGAIFPDLMWRGRYRYQNLQSSITLGTPVVSTPFDRLADPYNRDTHQIDLGFYYSGLPRTDLGVDFQWRNVSRKDQGSFTVMGADIDVATRFVPQTRLSATYSINRTDPGNWNWLRASANAYLRRQSRLKLQALYLPDLPWGLGARYQLENRLNVDNTIGLDTHSFGASTWFTVLDNLNLNYDFDYLVNFPTDRLTGTFNPVTNPSPWYISNYQAHSIGISYWFTPHVGIEANYQLAGTEDAFKVTNQVIGGRIICRALTNTSFSIGGSWDKYTDDTPVQNAQGTTRTYSVKSILINARHEF